MTKRGWTAADIHDQTGRVALITGANSGIGFETAKALAQKGATVVVACRSRERGDAAVASLQGSNPPGEVRLQLLDLASLASVRECASEFRRTHDRLDLLINNAGVMMPSKREETADGFELQIGTNHLGHFALTLQLLPLLVSVPGSRVVNVSSSAQNFARFDLEDLQWTKRAFHRMGSYGASKVANMLFTLELQSRFTEGNVGSMATACHPGWTSTNLQKTTPLFRWLSPLFGMKPWQGALPTLFAAVSPEAAGGGYYGPNGFRMMRGYPAENKPAAISSNADAAESLWRHSEQLVGLTAMDFTTREEEQS